jgi:uncharacterized membrane protein
MAVKTTNSTTSLSPNVAGALCYVPVVGWVASLVLLIVEKNPSVRWNAVQSLLLSGVLWLVGVALTMTIVLALLIFPVMIAGLILNLVLAVKTYKNETVKLPVLSDWTDKVLKKV